MNESNESNTPPAADDPRYAFAAVTEALGGLVEAAESAEPSVLAAGTPCPEFTVETLLDHIVMVIRRVAAIGNGEHFSTVEQDELKADWAKAYRESAHAVMEAWTDAAKLEQMFEVPWGSIPGAPLIYTYTAELAVHGWDLAQGAGLEFTVPDDLLHGALVAAKFIPEEGRDTPEVPFGAVVDPGPEAPVLLHIAGWLGREVANA